MSTPVLSVRDLQVTARSGRVLLKLSGLDMHPGTVLAVTGASGSGKSTLLAALAGLTPRSRGQIRWIGEEFSAFTAARKADFRSRHLGLMFKDLLLFDELGAVDNAAILEGFRPRRQRRILRREATDRLARLGLGGAVLPELRALNAAEQQRVALARALAHDPAVLLADEPTAALDSAGADALIRDMLEASRGEGRCLLVTSHDAALLERADMVLRLDHGEVAGDPA